MGEKRPVFVCNLTLHFLLLTPNKPQPSNLYFPYLERLPFPLSILPIFPGDVDDCQRFQDLSPDQVSF